MLCRAVSPVEYLCGLVGVGVIGRSLSTWFSACPRRLHRCCAATAAATATVLPSSTNRTGARRRPPPPTTRAFAELSMSKPYTLPDGTRVTLARERYRAAEVLFEPAMQLREETPLQDAVLDCE